jgi:hypothetical protein
MEPDRFRQCVASGTAEVEVTLDAMEVGEQIGAMDTVGQMRFFIGMAKEAKSWDKPADFQWRALADELSSKRRDPNWKSAEVVGLVPIDPELIDEAINMMRCIVGMYGEEEAGDG